MMNTTPNSIGSRTSSGESTESIVADNTTAGNGCRSTKGNADTTRIPCSSVVDDGAIGQGQATAKQG